MSHRYRILSVIVVAISFFILGTGSVWATTVTWERGFCFIGDRLDFFSENNFVDGIGDINSDGVPDILGGTAIQVGRYVVLSGASGAVLKDVTSPGFERQGAAVAAYGDYNGDGVADFLVGAQFADPGGRASAGEVRLISGADGSILKTFEGPNANDMIGGTAIVTVGDINGDGVLDVAVGAPSAAGGGKIYLFSGADASILWTSTEGAIYDTDMYGYHIDVVGDVNGDGKPDIIAGTDAASDRFDPAPTRLGAVGEVRILSGDNGTTLHYFTVTNIPSWNGRIGRNVTGLGGDINRDGVPDAAFSADFWDLAGPYTSGQVVLVSGKDGAIIRIIDEKQLWDKSGVTGFSFNQGFDLDGIGDVDGDGLPDLVSGVVSFGWGGFGQGALAIYSSATGCLLTIVDSDLPQSTIPVEQLGRSAAGVGDIDGDGIPDVVGGAPFYSLSDGNDPSWNGRMCAFYLKPQPNQPPVADANGPYSSMDQSTSVTVQLDGSGSSDPDSCETLTYSWTTTCRGASFDDATAVNPVLTLDTTVGGCGPCDVSLTVTDSHGATDTDTTTVTIIDITPPSIADLYASPSLLWPANHKLIPIAVNYNASDNCSAPTCTLSATSNEPDNGLGDGDTANDIQLIDAHSLKLRAERSGKGSGRLYTITATCTDASGNSTSGRTAVTVPHDQNKK